MPQFDELTGAAVEAWSPALDPTEQLLRYLS
jgi:hypothetical protein